MLTKLTLMGRDPHFKENRPFIAEKGGGFPGFPDRCENKSTVQIRTVQFIQGYVAGTLDGVGRLFRAVRRWGGFGIGGYIGIAGSIL